MNTPSQLLLQKKLKCIIQKNPNTIKAKVAEEALSGESITCFFNDLFNYGCQCGMIGFLTYNVDTHAFYDKYYKEIEELREDYQDSLGEQLEIKGDLKNFLSWFAFEETAWSLSQELNLGI